MNLKNNILMRIAQKTRRHNLYFLDPLLRLIYNPDKRHNDSIETVIPLHNHILFHINTASYIEWAVFFYGYYEPFINTLIKSLIKPGDICIDVGANVGIHALFMAHRTGPTGKVFCFEPHPVIHKRLKKNIAINRFSWMHPIKKGIAERSGTEAFQGFSDSSSNQGTSHLLNHAQAHTPHTFTIDLTTLDEFVAAHNLERVNFIKVDVEGFEHLVIQGATKTLTLLPTIIFENNRKDLTKAILIIEQLTPHYYFYGIMFTHLLPLTDKNILHSCANILAVPRQETRFS